MDVDLGIGPPPVSDDGEPDVWGPDPDPTPSAGGVTAGAPWEPDLEPELAPEVPEPVVRGMLQTLGTVLSVTPIADADVPDHWQFTPAELDALTPPVTRIVNARPQLRAAVQRGDELTVAVQLAGYAGRNVMAGAAARRARLDNEEMFEDGHVDRQADGASPPGGGGARDAADPGRPAGFAAAAGVGVRPPDA